MNNTGRTVLVVEDEALVRAYAAGIFEDAGLSVIEAENADQAMRLFAEGAHVDAVLTDINLHGETDGVELAWEISRRFPHAAILITSGAVRPDRKAMPPASGFIAKPYAADSILHFFAALWPFSGRA
jgi:two-component system, response regulator PdtaR